jgi:SNF2 family DNA or RNA helicase/uncharacterized Zn finger protein
MATYGKTWWGQKWLDAFNGIDASNRLPRGRTYANKGAAYDIKIDKNKITAKVQGSMRTPYDVQILLSTFSKEQIETIREAVIKSPHILAKLLNRELPSSLLKDLEDKKIQLFPTEWKEIKGICSCPDYAVPCKHLASVIYLVANAIDANPFTVFDMRGCKLLEIVGEFDVGDVQVAQKIKSIDTVLTPCTQPRCVEWTHQILADVNFSIIPELSERIHGMLTPQPSFAEGDFRDKLQLAYRHWKKNASLEVSNESPVFVLRSKKELTAEERFLKKWNKKPDRWSNLRLIVDAHHQYQYLDDGAKPVFEDNWFSMSRNFICFLNEIPGPLLHRLSPAVKMWHLLNQYAKKLIDQSAFIPQILESRHGHAYLRWIPALFDENTRKVFDQICNICPANLVQYGETPLIPSEQVLVATAFLLGGYLYRSTGKTMKWHQLGNIGALFLEGRIFKNDDFEHTDVPNTIHLWLSRLHQLEKKHQIYLTVKDKKGAFDLSLKVAFDENSAPINLSKALKTKDKQNKVRLLTDLAVLYEYIPSFEHASDTDTLIHFKLEDFKDIFFKALPILKALGIQVALPKSLQEILRPRLNLKMEATPGGPSGFCTLENLLAFDWQIAIGKERISIQEFEKMLKNSRGLVYLRNQYVMFDEREMESLLKRLKYLPEKLDRFDLLQAGLSGEIDGASVDVSKQIEALFNKLSNYKAVPIPKNLKASLRPYQERGFSWLVQNLDFGFGSIIADDMGLGKTLQIIAALLHCKNQGLLKDEKALIVAPTSLLTNWKKEVERFAPDLKLGVFHGQGRGKLGTKGLDGIITSYGLARGDLEDFKKEKWFVVVIDEAQNIKNAQTDQSKAIKSIPSKHKIAMSGTPVENRLLEYWSLFDFANKNYLGTATHFYQRFAAPIEKERDHAVLERFTKITKPFILRRLKTDKSIISDLPEKVETNRYCAMTPTQVALYQEAVTAALNKIKDSEGIERKGLVFQMLNSLKQICNHPAQFTQKKKAAIAHSGKLQMLEDILAPIDELGEKTIIFTQYTAMGTLLTKTLEERFNFPVPFLHGGLSRNQRDELVHDFQNQSQVRTLIISLRAGGTGLNLTAANHVVHYDLWWNPAVEAQATDRAYRIGQNKKVMVYRLITSNTFEERINDMIQSKKELANLTVKSGEQWLTELDNNALKDLVTLR